MTHSHTPPPHLLIIDDDSRICRLLQQFLMRNGFLVTTAASAQECDKLLRGLVFDLFIIDVMMPGEDGISLTRRLAQAPHKSPIILLTAKSETNERILGLEAGADDYITKPFEPRELVLRVNAILRRSAPQAAEAATGMPPPPQALLFGPKRYDLARNALLEGEVLVHLTQSELNLLRLFAQRPHEVLSRLALSEMMGKEPSPAQERAIDVQITRLRRKLEDDPRQPRYLQTIRGTGYKLTPD